jgi:hypothetical protein
MSSPPGRTWLWSAGESYQATDVDLGGYVAALGFGLAF